MAKPKSHGLTSAEAAKKSFGSKAIVNASINVTIANKKIEQNNSKETKKYKCTACGQSWDTPKKFNKSKSPLFAGNDGYVNICADCRDPYYYSLVELYSGNEEKSIDRMCQIFDWFFHEEPLGASKQISEDRSRVGDYANKLNLSQTIRKGSTYIDTIKFRASEEKSIPALNGVESIEDLDKKSQKNIEKWGMSYSPEEFIMLNDHYKLYKDRIDEDDPTQVTLLRSLCEQYILQARCLTDKDIDKYEKVSKLYQQTLNNANLKPKVQDNNSNNPDECWGNFNQIVEKFSPAEYYKDKGLFKDYDEQDAYYRRFVERPTNNLINGTTDMDDEYVIKVTDDE